MKRRNPDTQKLRKLKKRPAGEGGMGSGGYFVYVKLLFAWSLLIVADFVLGFRFEYLWPFWLLLRSIYDSFRYQGMAFSVFFVCMTFTSDLVCFLFIPVQWLFFLASTYVWVQYVWHADRGVCLPSLGLWLFFVYIEASIRLKELSAARSFPFTLDLCRPFAAHCIGYPVVTLGFGLKSYVGYKFRLRKQREVAKENKFYDKLLAEALPAEYEDPPPAPASSEAAEELLPLPNSQQRTPPTLSATKNGRPPSANGAAVNGGPSSPSSAAASTATARSSGQSWTEWLWSAWSRTEEEEDDEDSGSEAPGPSHHHHHPHPPPKPPRPAKTKQPKRPPSRLPRDSSAPQTNSATFNSSSTKDSPGDDATSDGRGGGGGGGLGVSDEGLLEAERLRGELRQARREESELRSQLSSSTALLSQLRSESSTARSRAEGLEAKLANASRAREQERTLVQTLERKLMEEQRLRKDAEEKNRKQPETKARADCSEPCRQRKREMENDLRLVRRDLRLREDQLLVMDADLKELQRYKEQNGNSDLLLSALENLREKNEQLEKSLSAENKLKQDLFSALGEANRKLEMAQTELMRKNRELASAQARKEGGGGGGAELDQNLHALAANVAAATASPLFDAAPVPPASSPNALPLSFTPPRSL